MSGPDDTREEIMMARWALTNGNGYDVFPTSEDDLCRGLAHADALARDEGRPRVAVLTPDPDAEDVAYLCIGVGADDSVLVYEPGDEDDGGYSHGTRVGDTTPVTFAYGTTPTEYLAWMLIPKETAFAAAAEFFRTGKRPDSVAWADL
jgi:hypothetical protein